MVHDESTHLARLSQDLLDFSRLERKKFSLTPRWIDLSYLIHQASAEASGLAGNRTIEVRIPGRNSASICRLEQHSAGCPQSPDHCYRAHPRYKAPSTSPYPRGPNPQIASWSAFTVKDMVLSADELSHIFEPFAIRYPTASHGKRTWLGLAISKAIIESQGGAISASSADGAGATFAFSLPAATWAPEDNESEE